jgi:hypothetical protein
VKLSEIVSAVESTASDMGRFMFGIVGRQIGCHYKHGTKTKNQKPKQKTAMNMNIIIVF